MKACTHLFQILFQWSLMFTLLHSDGHILKTSRKIYWLFNDMMDLVKNVWSLGVEWGHIGNRILFLFTECWMTYNTRTQFLALAVVGFMHQSELRLMFQHDNTKPHTTRISMSFLQQKSITVMSTSPDLNPIKHMRDELNQCVSNADVKTNHSVRYPRNLTGGVEQEFTSYNHAHPLINETWSTIYHQCEQWTHKLLIFVNICFCLLTLKLWYCYT